MDNGRKNRAGSEAERLHIETVFAIGHSGCFMLQPKFPFVCANRSTQGDRLEFRWQPELVKAKRIMRLKA